MTSPDTPPAMPDPHQPYPVSYPQPEQEPLTLANVLPAGQHRSRARLVVGLTAALVLVGVVVGTVGVLTLKNIGPFKDSGIAICENIRDHGKSSASASPSGDAATS